MWTPLTEEEMQTTASQRLAHHIGFGIPLTLGDVEDIVGQGLADAAEFALDHDDPNAEPAPQSYSYVGGRWAVECHHGRPHLVEAVDVPPDAAPSAVAEAERGFALAIYLTEMTFDRPMSEDLIAEARRGPWERILDGAAERREGSDGAEEVSDDEEV